MNYHHTVKYEEQRQAVDELLRETYKLSKQEENWFRRNVVILDGEMILTGDLPIIIIGKSGNLKDVREYMKCNGMVAICEMERGDRISRAKAKYSLANLIEERRGSLDFLKKYNWKAIITLKARSIAIKKLFPDIIRGLRVDYLPDGDKAEEKHTEYEEKLAEVEKIARETKQPEIEKVREKMREHSAVRSEIRDITRDEVARMSKKRSEGEKESVADAMKQLEEGME